jgi:inosose dehydratase
VHAGGIFDATHVAPAEIVAVVRAALEFAASIEARDVSLHPPRLPDGDGRDPPLRERGRQVLTEALQELLPIAASRGQRLSLETHCYPPYVFTGPPDLEAFVEGFSDLGYVVDVAHMHHGGLDYVAWVRRWAARLWGMHVSDAVPGAGLQAGVHLPFHEGSVDLPAVVAALRDVGYEGFLALEVKGTEGAVGSSCGKLLALLSSS